MIRLLIASALLGLVLCDEEKKCGKCPTTPKLYEELRCVGVRDNDGCCFERFDCPDWNALNSDKCHYKGKSYNISESISRSDSPMCKPGCHCRKGYNGKRPRFECPMGGCPEDLYVLYEPGCVVQYRADKCCAVDAVCSEDKIEELAKCEFEGKTYREGAKMYTDRRWCGTCLCTKDFNSSVPIELNKNCEKIQCGIEMYSLYRIQSGCVPVYFDTSACCPFEFRCPSSKDEVMPIEGRADVDAAPEKMCKYGEHNLHIGQSLNSLDKCAVCTCKQPPMVECITNSECYRKEFEKIRSYV